MSPELRPMLKQYELYSNHSDLLGIQFLVAYILSFTKEIGIQSGVHLKKITAMSNVDDENTKDHIATVYCYVTS